MTPETLAKYRDLLDGLKSGSRTVERVTHEVGDFFDDGTMLVTACEYVWPGTFWDGGRADQLLRGGSNPLLGTNIYKRKRK